ncbi:IclR family transcriptional regulator [Vibrio alginolyticus]|nr:IclR family transcriptional regulator [Vibrio alginolyticus]
MTTTKKNEYRAPALEKGLDILELLAASTVPLTKKQIAEKLDRSISEIFRMLSVLVERQYIEFDSDQSTYSLSLRMFVLSNQHPPVAQMLKRATPMMEDLCLKVNQSCHLSQYKHGELVVISVQESPYKMGFGLRLGATLDVCSSGSGIVLLAFSSEQQREKILKQSGATEVEIQHALTNIAKTQTDGYYLGASPQISGVTNISFPIFGALGELIAVMTVPYMTLNSRTVHHHIEDIEQTRQELSYVAKYLSMFE